MGYGDSRYRTVIIEITGSLFSVIAGTLIYYVRIQECVADVCLAGIELIISIPVIRLCPVCVSVFF